MNEFFSPASVAIVGASATSGKMGHEVLRNIIDGQFPGKIFPINPHETKILDIPVYKNLSDTPSPSELAIIVVPAKIVPSIVQEGAENGTRNFVIITAGFGETGKEGALLDEELKKLIEKHDLHIMGPNCLGVINPHAKLNASFGGTLPAAGNMALVSQSGAIISSLCDWSGLRHFGFSKVISLGNKLQLDENASLEFLENDPDTSAIVLYLERFNDEKKFLEIATRLSKKKSVILYKSGTTALGRSAVEQHSGAEASEEGTLCEDLEEAGVFRATSVERLFDIAHLCSCQPLPKGARTVIVTNAGGPGVIATDAIDDDPYLDIANLSEEVKNELNTVLPFSTKVHSPVDLIGDALADRYAKSLEVLLKSDAADAYMVMLSPQAMTQSKESAEAIIAANKKYPNTPMVTCFMGGSSVREGTELLLKAGIPCFLDPARAIWALGILRREAKIRER